MCIRDSSEWVPGSAGATAAGAANQIQYNDGAGGLAASSDFTVNVDWDNASTTFTALKVNVPDVLQGFSDSKLLDLQAGGTSLFSVSSTRGDITTNAQRINLASDTTSQGHIYAGPGGAGNPIDLAGRAG